MTWAIYGANGYTGRLIAREAIALGHRPTLIGRNPAAIEREASELALPWAAARLEDRDAVGRALAGHSVVLHCAGPFHRTAGPMVTACLALGVSYLDITGEIAVLEAVASRDREAKSRNLCLVPGVGFDVVPTDCLAAHLARRLPGAVHLSLAFSSTGGLSRGTALTMVSRLGEPGAIRREGRIIAVPVAWQTRMVDFGQGQRLTVSIPWGDIATATRTTGIGDVVVYTAVSRRALFLLRGTRWIAPLLALPPVRSAIAAVVRRRVTGPDDAARADGRSHVWGEAVAADGGRVVSRLWGPEGYTLTALAAVRAAERVVQGQVAPGYQTPASAFGADFVLDLPGVRREDVE